MALSFGDQASSLISPVPTALASEGSCRFLGLLLIFCTYILGTVLLVTARDQVVESVWESSFL